MGNVRLSYGRNSTGALEITDNNDYYPFGMNHFKTGTAFFRQGSYKNYKYSNKELQETGMYSYGWREYMPDLGRWNGIDQLAENYLSTSTYAYVANNPISLTDPDGRWIYEDGSIGQGPSPLSLLGPSHHAYMSFSMSDGISYNSGAGGGGGAYNFTGNDAASVFNYFKNGGNINGFSVNNGYARWWTDGDIMGYKKVINGETETGVRELVMHSAKLSDTSWDSYKNWADYGSGTLGTMYEAIADQRNDLYRRGYWIDDLGNQRSVRYAGRAADSQIGLRSSYVRNTAKFAKYGKGLGYVGYAINAAEIGYGVYEDKGWGKNANIAFAEASTGIVVGTGVGIGATWLTGAIAGAAGGSVAPGVGTIIGFIVGGVAGYFASDYVGELVENSYK